MKLRKSAKGMASAQVRRMYSAERVMVLSRLTGRLWAEMQGWLGVMEGELRWLGGGGEAPVLACRARVRMMRGAMQGLAGDLKQLYAEPGDEIEAWRWLEEFDRAIKSWIKALEKELKEYGATPDGEDPRDDMWFTPEYAMALGLLSEAYRDWWFVAWNLASIEAPAVAVSEIERIDQKTKFVEARWHARRPALRTMPKRSMAWSAR
jgi:hypothetical protein